MNKEALAKLEALVLKCRGCSGTGRQQIPVGMFSIIQGDWCQECKKIRQQLSQARQAAA